jgi:DNA modification methylase
VTTPYYADDYLALHAGKAQQVLPRLPTGSVQTCVTSPPYFGLRSYLPDGVVLRDDLTDDERAYVLAELERLGIG